MNNMSCLVFSSLARRVPPSCSTLVRLPPPCQAPLRLDSMGEGGTRAPNVQPFSHNSRTPTVAKEFQIGLYDPAEADLEHFWNCCSAGFLGEPLYSTSPHQPGSCPARCGRPGLEFTSFHGRHVGSEITVAQPGGAISPGLGNCLWPGPEWAGRTTVDGGLRGSRNTGGRGGGAAGRLPPLWRYVGTQAYEGAPAHRALRGTWWSRVQAGACGARRRVWAFGASLGSRRAHARARARRTTTALPVGRSAVGGEARLQRDRKTSSTLPPHHHLSQHATRLAHPTPAGHHLMPPPGTHRPHRPHTALMIAAVRVTCHARPPGAAISAARLADEPLSRSTSPVRTQPGTHHRKYRTVG